MIKREDVIRVFTSWRSAGLHPPIDKGNVEQANACIDDFLYNYGQGLSSDQLQTIGKQFAHGRHWPTYFEIDEAIRELKRQAEPKGYEGNLMAEIKKKGPVLTESFEEMVLLTARRLWPNADEKVLQGLIENNKLAIFNQGWADRVCACCDGRNCQSAGHRSKLRIVANAKEPVVYQERVYETCEKYNSTSRCK